MSFFETLEALFGVRDLYEVLHLTKTASESEIKRAYRKKSLQVHPDRASDEDREEATKRFQCLGQVYSVLSDPDRRAIYDESGEVEDDIIVQERDWEAYWRLLFKKITVEDIAEFEKQYKGSEEEMSDLKAAYLDYEGDMDAILENVMCATVDDDERFRKIIKELISKENLPKFPAFVNEGKKKKRARKEKVSDHTPPAPSLPLPPKNVALIKRKYSFTPSMLVACECSCLSSFLAARKVSHKRRLRLSDRNSIGLLHLISAPPPPWLRNHGVI